MGVCVSLPLPSVHYPGAGNDISDVNELGLDVVHGGGRWWGSAEFGSWESKVKGRPFAENLTVSAEASIYTISS